MKRLVKFAYIVVGEYRAWPHSYDLTLERLGGPVKGIPSRIKLLRIPRPRRRLVDGAGRASRVVKAVMFAFRRPVLNFLLCGCVVVMLESRPDPLLSGDRFVADVKSDQTKISYAAWLWSF